MKNIKHKYLLLIFPFLLKSEISIVKNFLNKFKRPFTLLNLDRNSNIVIDLCKTFSESTILTFCDNETINKLKKESIANIIASPLIPNDTIINKLSECEHFDVTIASEINNTKIITELINLGTFLITKIKNNIQPQSIVKHNENKIYIYKFEKTNSNFNYYIFFNNKLRLKKHYYDGPMNFSTNKSIFSNFHHKKMTKFFYSEKVFQESEWKHGINLVTYKALKCKLPSQATLVNALQKHKNIKHQDFVPHNLVVQGSKIEVIDLNDLNKAKACKEQKHNGHTFKAAAKTVEKFIKLPDKVDAEKILPKFFAKVPGEKIK